MTEIILIIAVALLAVLGLSELLNLMIYKIFCTHPKKQPVLLIPLKGDDAEMVLRAAVARERVPGAGKCGAIIAVDCGISAEAAESSRRFCSRNAGISVCRIEQLQEILLYGNCSMSDCNGRTD